MAKIWIDFVTPKDVLFLGKISEKLQKDGHSLFLTSRRYRELNSFLRLKGLKTHIIGRHGGETLEGKLKAYGERLLLLTNLVSKAKPGLSVAFSSPEAARVAFGLKIPHVCIGDSPHAVAVSKLTVPLSRLLLTPDVIPLDEWTQYGISAKNVVAYNGLDVVSWVRETKPNPVYAKKFKLKRGLPLVVARPEESFASYMLEAGSYEKTPIIPILKKMREGYPQAQILIIPRYSVQRSYLRRALTLQVKVARRALDVAGVLAMSNLFIGAGGTMTEEAALLGIPTISCAPREPTWKEKYLIDKGLVYLELDVEKAAAKAIDILRYPEKYVTKHQNLAKQLVDGMEDPVSRIVGEIEKLLA